MKMTDWARRALAYRREQRDLPKQGWEYVGERGGNLWELHRGYRYDHRITDVRIAVDGKGLWVKTAPKEGGQKVRMGLPALYNGMKVKP